jgi:hypothetical protein
MWVARYEVEWEYGDEGNQSRLILIIVLDAINTLSAILSTRWLQAQWTRLF